METQTQKILREAQESWKLGRIELLKNGELCGLVQYPASKELKAALKEMGLEFGKIHKG